MPDREKVRKGLRAHAKGCGYRSDYCDFMECPYRIGDESCDIEQMCIDALAMLKEYEQSEQSYLRTLVELSNERDKLLKELGREDEHKYKDGSFMAGGNGIVKL